MVPEINPAGSASLSAYAGERGGARQPQATKTEAVLPPQTGITLEQDGNQRWLRIAAPADQVWPKVREFWTSNGFALKRDDPTIGIMETDWVENRADIPQDGVRAILKNTWTSFIRRPPATGFAPGWSGAPTARAPSFT